MKRIVAIALLALLFLQTSAFAGGTLSDAVLLDALEKGRSLVVVRVLSTSEKDEQRTKTYLFRARVLNLVTAGDVARADVQSPIDLHAGASYGKALAIGRCYALFVTKDAPFYFSWAHRDDVIAIDPEDPEAIEQLESQAARIYARTRVKNFRNAIRENGGALPPIPDTLRVTCARFKSHKEDRCDLARKIWKSSLGSDRDESRPWASSISYLPPKTQLSRAQALQLLGEPTIKIGYEYKWFCGKDSPGHAGVLAIEFHPNGTVRTLVYVRESLGRWMPNRVPDTTL